MPAPLDQERRDATHGAASPAGADRAETAARLAVVVGRINRRIRAVGEGLTQAQLSALSSIVRKGPLRPGDLARIESVAAPSATRVVAELESRGLIAREPDPADGRSSLVSATDAGQAAVLAARAERAKRISVLLAGLDDDELATVVAALDALEIVAVHVPLPPGAEADRAE
ncbi:MULTISPECIES: MarR family winged helix-turn-helix transcriptional regulator [Humibacter]